MININMERLTVKTQNGWILKCCNECLSATSCNSPCFKYFEAIDKLASYENKEEAK